MMYFERGGDYFMLLIVCVGVVGDGEKGRLYIDGFVGVDIYIYYWSD